MALSGSVPVLLLPLLLTSALAYRYYQLPDVTISSTPESSTVTSSEEDCALRCDRGPVCSGYKYSSTDGVCGRYWLDCRGPGANSSNYDTDFMAKDTCPGEKAEAQQHGKKNT